MKKQCAKFGILFLLIVMFAAPGVAAYLFYEHPAWLGASRINKGVLLSPAVQLTFLEPSTKWRIVYWSPTQCTEQCMSHLDVLARVRLALGRKFYQVQQILLSGVDVHENAAFQKTLKEKDIQSRFLSHDELNHISVLGAKAQIFIMNPQNYLILSYQDGVNPDDVYKDLKLLL